MIIVKIILFILLTLFVMAVVSAVVIMLTAQQVLKRGRANAKAAQETQAARNLHDGAEMVECPRCGTYVAKTPAFEKAGVCRNCLSQIKGGRKG